MGKLIVKLFIFLLPFLIYASVVYFVDPFCYFNSCPENETKESIAKKLNDPLWKILQKKDYVEEHVYLGGSKMALFNESAMEEFTSEEFSNFTFGGCTVEEEIKLFWIIADDPKLKNIYFEIDLFNYNENNRRDRITGINGMLQNPLLYLFNFNVLEGSLGLLKSPKKALPTQKKELDPEVKQKKKEKFWKSQLSEAATRYLDIYVYPESYEYEFAEIKKHCDKNDIQIHFVFTPIHKDLLEIIKSPKYDLLEERNRIISFLQTIGNVYVMDIENEITISKDNFGDPFHIKSSVLNKTYLKELLSDTLTNSALMQVYHFEK